ncbi:MAG: hypothetical protein ACRD12_19310 [Acidimicrobiales bacterium]
MATTKEDQVVVAVPFDQAYQRVVTLLQGMKWTITTADPQAGVVTATTGVSLASWGETVTVRLAPAEGGGTTAYITSAARLKTNITAGGRNRKNVEAVASQLRI